ncbi:hypothetical protein [Streptomyces sp. NPDC052494]|uniref:hypothetical protein n=1 Tax=Streptomyces sp. NPDC052494 TaxID=3365692 RepID=UPI0037CEDF13
MSLVIRLFRFRPKELAAMNAEGVLAEIPLDSDAERFAAAHGTGLLLDLSKDVRMMAEHLGAVDPWRQVNGSLAAMESVYGSEIEERFARHLATVLRDVASFYAAAASNGDAVVKVAYA